MKWWKSRFLYSKSFVWLLISCAICWRGYRQLQLKILELFCYWKCKYRSLVLEWDVVDNVEIQIAAYDFGKRCGFFFVFFFFHRIKNKSVSPSYWAWKYTQLLRKGNQMNSVNLHLLTARSWLYRGNANRTCQNRLFNSVKYIRSNQCAQA